MDSNDIILADNTGNKDNNKKKKNIFKKILNFFNIVFNSKKYSFIFLTIILLIVTAILIIYPLTYNTFFNCNTDDIIQYHSYVIGFFNKLKTNTLSIYDTSLWGGTSFFASVYYLPLDLFLCLAFILSYIMPTEIAYVLSNILRIVAGCLVFYIFLTRKNFKIRVSIIASLILFVGGITEAEFVFPVYLGICFYAPLALLIVDLVVEHKKCYYLLIPLYTFVVIIYDYYIAYMLLALLCIYFVIAYHMYSKKFFLATKHFYIDLIKLFFFIGIGLLIGAFIMVPSLFYVLNESSRTNSEFDHSFWYFTKWQDGGYVLSIRHYFTGWMNLFSPNNPFNLALVEAGDYIREHYSLYITTGGLIYLILFFFTRGKKNHRLKFWVLLFNIMFLMPIFSMIFTVSKWAYSRWFFIPYMINIYAMAIGMNDLDFKVGKKNFIKIFPMIILALGLISTFYTLLNNPDIFIHYSSGDNYFSLILIGSSIFIILYLIILLIYFIFQILGKEKIIKLCPHLILVTIILEVIFAGIVDFSTVGSTDYMYKHNIMENEYYHLYDLGYNPSEGYRINLYTDQGRSSANANVMFGMTNHGQFFQSFYNTPLNTYVKDIHADTSDSWSRGTILGYTLVNSPMFNYKYFIANKNFAGLYLPEKYYNLLDEKEDVKYYELKDAFNFIIYDSIYTDLPFGASFYNDVSLLNYGYVKKPTKNIEAMNDEEKKQYDMAKLITDSNIKIKTFDSIQKEIDDNYHIITKNLYNVSNKEFDGYFKYDISSTEYDELFNMDSIYILPRATDIAKLEYDHMYIKHCEYYDEVNENEETETKEKDTYFYPLHYNVLYKGYNYNSSPRQELWMEYKEQTNSKTITMYGYNYDIYDDFVEKQNEYKNRKFILNDNKINISFTNTSTDTKIVKTGFTYSDDWKVEGDYQTCNINGGFLGIIVKGDIKDVNINLTFIPKYYDSSLKLTALGCILYMGITISMLGYAMIRKKRMI